MQWFKSAMVVSTMLLGVGALCVNGCSGPNKNGNDAGGDVVVTGHDSGKDAPNSGDSSMCGAVACEVCDVSGYMFSPQGKPIGPKSGACSASEIQAFVAACLSSTTSSQTACNTWQMSENNDAGGKCLACTFTQQTTSSWGVFVCGSSSCSLNIPGCLDLALGQTGMESTTTTPSSCGDYLSQTYGCQDAACSACTTTDFSTCDMDAIANQCATSSNAFQMASSCAALNGDAAPAAVGNCFPASQTGFTDTELQNLTNYFCGM